ncbi:hypothetical protein GCM10029976_090780 [Kribbella albertanoniae]|uniref:Uncharacterized protein n=1 Tax=Kribbella albertanoniae TaxID=1266829 RepID=A0A4R4PJP3_9ACTN|nr:hypothetical protein [Kribbella albertanoniae]TDC22148.1 hypothetical protein E1261_31660 [Kribbella albertanoniae]
MALPEQVPCGFCREPDRWPDSCPGDPPDSFCLGEIDHRHDMGDHRRCVAPDCEGALLVAEAAIRGSRQAIADGLDFAVVNTFTDPWEIRSFAQLQQAKPYRTRCGKAAGVRWSIEYKGRVFVVTRSGVVL